MLPEIPYPTFDADVICEDTRELPRDEWLELRRRGLGGSDAPATLGLSPYVSPVALYLDKVDPRPDEDKPIYEAGRRAEPMIAEWFADKTGFQVVHYPVMLRSRRWSFMLANVDRFIINEDGEWCVLEIKNVDRSKAHDWKGGPPLYARIQGLHYLAVCGEHFAKLYVAACIGGNEYVYYEIERDDELLADLIGAEEKFWTMVQLERMPDIDGSDSTRKALRSRFDADKDSSIEVSEKFMSLLKQQRVIKTEQKILKDRLQAVENQMIKEIGEHEVALYQGEQVATFRTVTKGEYVVKAQSYRQWRVTRQKEEK